MQVALASSGIRHGEPVLTNGFTLSPVPGAIYNAGGHPVLGETTDQLVIDLDDPPDFLAKLKQTVDFKQVLTECAATPVTGGSQEPDGEPDEEPDGAPDEEPDAEPAEGP